MLCLKQLPTIYGSWRKKEKRMGYKCEATSLKGFVQQLACNYLLHGYRWFVQGRIPDGKDPSVVDASIVNRYGIDIAESTRYRRKKLGKANLQYLRYGQDFVLIATNGRHEFKDVEAKSIRDIEDGKSRILVRKYSISRRSGGADGKLHSHVQIDWEHYKGLKAMFVGKAFNTKQVAAMFYQFPFEPYAPIQRQLISILKEVNRRRRSSGLPQFESDSLPPLFQKSVKVYEPGQIARFWSDAGKWWYEVRQVHDHSKSRDLRIYCS